MLTRTKRVTLTFQHPFSLDGVDRSLRPATMNDVLRAQMSAFDPSGHSAQPDTPLPECLWELLRCPVLSIGDYNEAARFYQSCWRSRHLAIRGPRQQSGKLPRVGILEPYAATDPGYRMAQALYDTGIEEGRDIAVEWRYAGGQTGRIPALAADLAQLRLDAIVAIGDVAVQAVRKETATTPIIAGSDDLVGERHVASLAHPGGNVTGISILASELNAKRLEVLKEAAPSVSRVVVLWDPATGTFHLPILRSVSENLRVELQVHEVTGGDVLNRTFDAARAWGANGLNVLASPLLHALRQPIIDQAAADQLPAIYQWGESARAGGLMSYGPFRNDVYQAISRQLARILKGADVAELPVEQPTRFELVINLKTARVLGLAISPLLLARADEVIR